MKKTKLADISLLAVKIGIAIFVIGYFVFFAAPAGPVANTWLILSGALILFGFFGSILDTYAKTSETNKWILALVLTFVILYISKIKYL